MCIRDSAYISQALGISDRRAADAIDALVSIDALRQIGSGQRNRRWQAPEILAPSTSSPNESPADSHRLSSAPAPVSYTHLRAHETVLDLVCRLLLEKKNYTQS